MIELSEPFSKHQPENSSDDGDTRVEEDDSAGNRKVKKVAIVSF